VTKDEMLTFRFAPFDMNLLQLICFEEATSIFLYIVEVLKEDSKTRQELA